MLKVVPTSFYYILNKMTMEGILIDNILKGKVYPYTNKIVSDAEMYLAFYSGENQDKILNKYRSLETDGQKKQRARVSIARTKHVVSQVENIIDQLQTLDTPAIFIGVKNEVNEELTELSYNLNINQRAFEFVKYYNLVDANAFVVFSEDEFGEPTFDIIESKDVFGFKIKNDRVEYLTVKVSTEKYRIYLTDKVIDVNRSISGTVTIEAEYPTKLNYAFHLGINKDGNTNFSTYKSILEPASEQLKSLVWDGSEYDVIKLLHGIVKEYRYVSRCNNVVNNDEGIASCYEGNLYRNNEIVGQCNVCNGTGKIGHTSSQDVIELPLPMNGNEEMISLDKLHHTIYLPESLFEAKKNDIKDTENQIIRTVFNSNSLKQEDVVRTATELAIDFKGVYSQWYKVGFKVSETYIWMIECLAAFSGIENVEVYHGYTMDVNLEDLQSLLSQREKAVVSGVGFEVIQALDRAIIKKQNMDNPNFIKRYETWETFRPFRDKTPNEKVAIIALLPENNNERILYTFWEAIKTEVLISNPNFYEMEREKQRELISNEIDKFRVSEPNVNFENLA